MYQTSVIHKDVGIQRVLFHFICFYHIEKNVKNSHLAIYCVASSDVFVEAFCFLSTIAKAWSITITNPWYQIEMGCISH